MVYFPLRHMKHLQCSYLLRYDMATSYCIVPTSPELHVCLQISSFCISWLLRSVPSFLYSRGHCHYTTSYRRTENKINRQGLFKIRKCMFMLHFYVKRPAFFLKHFFINLKTKLSDTFTIDQALTFFLDCF